jgi:hypothetical protein
MTSVTSSMRVLDRLASAQEMSALNRGVDRLLRNSGAAYLLSARSTNPVAKVFGDHAIHLLNLAGKLHPVHLDPAGDHSDLTAVQTLFTIIRNSWGPEAANTAIGRFRDDLVQRKVLSGDARTSALLPGFPPDAARPVPAPTTLQRSVNWFFDSQPAAGSFAAGAPGIDDDAQRVGNQARTLLATLGKKDADVRLEEGTADRGAFDQLVAVVRNTLGVNAALEAVLAVGRDMAKRRSPNTVPVLKECLPPSYQGALTPAIVALINGRNATGVA